MANVARICYPSWFCYSNGVIKVALINTAILLVGTISNTANKTNAIPGQMNIIQSLVASNIVSDANIFTMTNDARVNAISKSYTTMTNSFNGRIDSNIIKVFGEIAQREYWM